jgi:hypothetical protein
VNSPLRGLHGHGNGQWPPLPGLFAGYILPIASSTSNYSLKANPAISCADWLLTSQRRNCKAVLGRLLQALEAYFPIPCLARAECESPEARVANRRSNCTKFFCRKRSKAQSSSSREKVNASIFSARLGWGKILFDDEHPLARGYERMLTGLFSLTSCKSEEFGNFRLWQCIC